MDQRFLAHEVAVVFAMGVVITQYAAIVFLAKQRINVSQTVTAYLSLRVSPDLFLQNRRLALAPKIVFKDSVALPI